jgi:signal transduction histidine kinase
VSLRARLVLSYTFVVILCLGIVAVVVIAMLQSYRDELAMARLDDVAVAIMVQTRSLTKREASQQEIWANLQEQAEKTGINILLVDGEGNVLRQAARRGAPQQRYIEMDEKAPADGDATTRRGVYSVPNGQTYMYVAYQLSSGQTPASSLSLVLSVHRSGALSGPSLVGPFLWAGLIALAVSVVIAVLLARSVYRPVRRVTEAADRMAQGQYDQEVPVAGPREIKGLASGFNQMARQVRMAEQKLRYFVADVSHELRTPLTSIRGFAQAMLDGTADDEATRSRAAQVIEDESKKMIRQVNELLELSRMQSGQVEMAREPVDVKDLIEHCQEVFAIRAEEEGVTLRVEVEPLMPVVGDADRLEQVFSNLLDNALKHSPSGSQVTIVGGNVAMKSVVITVADSGPGIPPEQLAHVFERFYRAGAERTGTGLGLAIVREIVVAHGGGIEVSSSPGEGTEFTVTLPTIASDGQTRAD